MKFDLFPIDDNTASYNLPTNNETPSSRWLVSNGSNLPGLVNSLMENDGKTTPLIGAPTTQSIPVTTRRSTISRGRRPQTVTRAQNTDDNSVPEITTRRPASRGRRPVNYATRTTTPRTPTVRASTRVRLNQTQDERPRPRTRTRTNTSRPTKENNDGKDEENIDYQRGKYSSNCSI